MSLRPINIKGFYAQKVKRTLPCPPVARACAPPYFAPGRDSLHFEAETATRLIFIGGEPLNEQIVMWWNFIGRSHEEVVQAREQWQAELGHAPDGRFGAFDYPGGEALPAPGLPNVRLRPRT